MMHVSRNPVPDLAIAIAAHGGRLLQLAVAPPERFGRLAGRMRGRIVEDSMFHRTKEIYFLLRLLLHS